MHVPGVKFSILILVKIGPCAVEYRPKVCHFVPFYDVTLFVRSISKGKHLPVLTFMVPKDAPQLSDGNTAD